MNYAQVITTFFDPKYMDVKERKRIAYVCSVSILDYLTPPPSRVYWADDHSPEPPTNMSVWEERVPTESLGVGSSLNAGMRKAREDGHRVALYAVDDWEARVRMDISEPLRFMREDHSVAAIRLAPPHPGLTGTVRHTPYGWYLEIDNHHYVVSHRPTLWNIQAVERLGWWPENCSAVDCERQMNERWRDADLWMRQSLRMLYWLPMLFEPMESASLSELDPTKR